MTDRESTLKGLTEISEYMRAKADIAGIGKGKEVFDSWYRAAEDALDLLREQEAVKPISAHVWAHTFGRCGNCEAPLPALEGLRSKFCWMCGKPVKWDA